MALSCGPNTCALLANGDGCAAARRRRQRTYQTTNAVSRLALATAPTMVPASFPPCDLPWFELGLGELGEVADGVDDASMVEGSIGVASGES